MPSRVGRVVNDCGIQDNVLLASQFLVLFTGMAGRTGFVGMNGPEFINRYSAFGHSGYFQDGRGAPTDEYMAKNWLPLIQSANPAIDFDARTTPSAWRGFVMWLSNNFEPIKLMATTLPLVLMLIYVGALYVKADAATERMSAVAVLAETMKRKNTLPPEAEPLLNSIEHALDSGLQRTAVLWVDDDPKGNYFEQRLLTRFGLCFAQARNTDEGIKYLEENPGKFAAVISDFSRPLDPKEGYGLLNEMKRRRLDIPFVFYALSFTEEQAAQARAKGARNEVRDPLDLLIEVTNTLPPESKDPSHMEFIMQKLIGCRGMWREPAN